MAWVQTGNIKGPKGDTGAKGDPGAQGIQGPAGAKGDQGPQGVQGVEGPQGPQGVKGEDGKGISIAGQVATYADLPKNLKAADVGKGWLVEADGKLYIWSGTDFPANGSGTEFRGAEGPRGPQGLQGVQGPQGVKGDTGDAGPQGLQGVKGTTGAAGARGSKWFTGSGAPGTIAGSAVGDMYLDTATGTVYGLS